MSLLWLVPALVLAGGVAAWSIVLVGIARARRELAGSLAEIAPVREAAAEVSAARRLAHDALEALDHR